MHLHILPVSVDKKTGRNEMVLVCPNMVSYCTPGYCTLLYTVLLFYVTFSLSCLQTWFPTVHLYVFTSAAALRVLLRSR